MTASGARSAPSTGYVLSAPAPSSTGGAGGSNSPAAMGGAATASTAGRSAAVNARTKAPFVVTTSERDLKVSAPGTFLAFALPKSSSATTSASPNAAAATQPHNSELPSTSCAGGGVRRPSLAAATVAVRPFGDGETLSELAFFGRSPPSAVCPQARRGKPSLGCTPSERGQPGRNNTAESVLRCRLGATNVVGHNSASQEENPPPNAALSAASRIDASLLLAMPASVKTASGSALKVVRNVRKPISDFCARSVAGSSSVAPNPVPAKTTAPVPASSLNPRPFSAVPRTAEFAPQQNGNNSKVAAPPFLVGLHPDVTQQLHCSRQEKTRRGDDGLAVGGSGENKKTIFLPAGVASSVGVAPRQQRRLSAIHVCCDRCDHKSDESGLEAAEMDDSAISRMDELKQQLLATKAARMEQERALAELLARRRDLLDTLGSDMATEVWREMLHRLTEESAGGAASSCTLPQRGRDDEALPPPLPPRDSTSSSSQQARHIAEWLEHQTRVNSITPPNLGLGRDEEQSRKM